MEIRRGSCLAILTLIRERTLTLPCDLRTRTRQGRAMVTNSKRAAQSVEPLGTRMAVV